MPQKNQPAGQTETGRQKCGKPEKWRNPLNYWCAPNAATPDYVTYRSLYEVAGFMLAQHAQGWAPEIEKHKKFEEFVQELQVNTLNIFAYFLSWLKDTLKRKELDKGQRYSGGDDFRINGSGMNHPNGNGFTSSHLCSEEEELAGDLEVKYSQYPEFFYDKSERHWLLRFDYMEEGSDMTTAWLEVRLGAKDIATLAAQLIDAKKNLAEAWDAAHLRKWATQEV